METQLLFTREPIRIPAIAHPHLEIGACVEFQGLVRQMEGGAPISGLWYDAYEKMAPRVMSRIFAEVTALHPCESVCFIHRLGWVPVGEASLFIRVLSAHRGEALQFVSEAIDRMKADAPIWKDTAKGSHSV